ncbi:MAG: hypothetical protein IJC13_04250 [Clostridia bacterium]|nr:hypothetical protein [Clostridia bacterium]
MAKKLLCIVLSVAMLLGVFAVAASAGMYYSYTPEEAEAEVAEKLWYVDYEADVDWKDEIDKRFLTPTLYYDGSATVAAAPEVLEENLYFWADEIIADYNAATSNEDYWNLYNKMATPEILYYSPEGSSETECDILYDYAYKYRDESKAVLDLDIVADTEYAKAGDVITVEVYATSNFRTCQIVGGIFYNKQYLKPLTIEYNTAGDPTWQEVAEGMLLEKGVTYDASGNVVSDWRHKQWPAAMQTEENFEKYGVTGVYFEPNESDPAVVHGRKFNGELLFTATYEVKADVPDGETLEFFVPADSVSSIQDLGVSEFESYTVVYLWQLLHVQYVGTDASERGFMLDPGSFSDQTVTSNVATVITGEEPAPAEKGEIVDVVTSDTYIGDTAVVSIDVTGAPEALNVLVGDGAQRFAREDADIAATDVGETWTIEILVNDAQVACSVVADYGELGTTDATDFVLTGKVKQDLSIHSIEIPDMYPDAQNGGMILAGKHDVIIKTSTDVVKIQFYAEDGTTYTYTSWSGAGKMPYEDIDGERVWTISHAFGPFGYNSLVIRTRSESTFFTSTGSTLDATVVY